MEYCNFRSLDDMYTQGAKALEAFDQDEMNLCFEDLINYFVQPEEDIGERHICLLELSVLDYHIDLLI